MLLGSPPCSPQMPMTRSFFAARPFVTAIFTSSPMPFWSREWKGSLSRMPCFMYDGRNLPASSLERPKPICVKSFVPKLKKSASFAISSAVIAALGTSIIVPILYGTVVFFSSMTFFAVFMILFFVIMSSFTSATSGTIISMFAFLLSFASSHAASIIARTCMSYIAGWVMPRRHPLWPSIGLASWSLWIVSFSLSGDICISLEIFSMSSLPVGRNSWRGGSRSLIVTGFSPITSKIP